jgi:hypothetical protein
MASIIDPVQQAEQFRQYIEKEVLLIIKSLAEKGDTTKERIQELAQLTLSYIKPGMSIEDLYMSATKLDDKHSELSPLVIMIMREYEEKYSMKAIDSVSALIKSGQYGQAESMVKKVLLFKGMN